MQDLVLTQPVVTANWLFKHLHAKNLVILNATLPKATEKTINSVQKQIPNSRFFDLKNTFSDNKAAFPNTVPTAQNFTLEAQKLGINKNSAIVIYDTYGIYSSARAWWLFKTFGHNNVAVLNGGLPQWEANNYVLEKTTVQPTAKGNFIANYQQGFMVNFKTIQQIKNNNQYIIIDARDTNRFNGLVSEPRPNLPSGNITGSYNLPYQKVLNQGLLVEKKSLKKLFNELNVSNKKLVFSCGSGITACILALAAYSINIKNIAVYDGSWTEYATLTNTNNMHWTKEELIAYTLLYAANSNFIEDNKERNKIIEHVNMQTFQKIHDEFDADSDYQSITKIQEALKAHEFNKEDTNALLDEVKELFFADGSFDILERNLFRSLQKILQ